MGWSRERSVDLALRARLDVDGLVESTRHGRSLGLFGRSVIHPRQIDPVRAAFTPSADEVRHAREIVDAADAAGAPGALALPDGRFIDAPVVNRARRVLDLAERLAT
ncbi:HpcH/HpaI aldolase/citrate lyase family protein [Saccharopolyspora hattusasensis]|uniref:HpcH/HpaI aldolase/citrate lyase family protein n=1 Tax=Saccharopolyspora hattusasensis TaxID=1128679 RepID=UPI003D977475